MSCCRTENKEFILSDYKDKFGNEMMPEKDPAKERVDVNLEESLITTYRGVRGKFESEEYV